MAAAEAVMVVLAAALVGRRSAGDPFAFYKTAAPLGVKQQMFLY